MAGITRRSRALVVGVALCGILGATVSPVGAAGVIPDPTAPSVPSGPAKPMIVMFRGAKPADGLRRAHASAGGFTVTKSYQRIPAVRAVLTPAQIQTLQQQPEVARVEPDRIISIKPEMVTPKSLDVPWSPTPIRVADPGIAAAETKLGLNGDAAHDGVTTYGPADEVIALVDSGVDASHPDLAGKILTFQNFVTTPDPSCPTVADPTVSWDDLGHGTHVAGIATGTGALDPAERGVAPGAALVVLKVFDCTGSASESQILAALDWLLGNHTTFGVDVVNMSFGSSGNGDGTDVLSQATNQLAAAGMVPAVAAGNAGPANGSIGSPGVARYALTVGAIKSTGHGRDLTDFSSRGPTADYRNKPDVATPGVDILAAGNMQFGTPPYRFLTGTSMATPVMAGLAALALQADPTLAPSGTACDPVADPVGCVDGVVDASMQEPLKARIRATAADWNVKGADTEVGAGVLNAYPFLQAAAHSKVRGPRVPKHIALQGHLDAQHGEQFVAVKATKDAVVSAGVSTGPVDFFNGPFAGLVVLDANGQVVPADLDCISNQFGYYYIGICGVMGNPSRFKGVWFKAPATGTYYIGVRSFVGTTDFILDIDGGTAYSGTARPACPNPRPLTGQRCAAEPVSIAAPTLVEGGPTLPVSVQLARKPIKPVQVRLVSDGLISVPATALTFTATNWSVPQTVPVSAVDDSSVQGLHHGRLIAIAAGARYADSGASLPLAVPIVDNDGPSDTPHTERVSLLDDGHESWGSAQGPIAEFAWQGPRVSDDGSIIAFESRATDLAGAGAAGPRTGVFVRDRATGHTEVVERSNASETILEGLSGDGRYVLFSSFAPLVPSDTNFDADLYLRDRTTGTVTRVNVGAHGEQMPRRHCISVGTCFALGGALSADGRSVAWITDVAMTPDDTDDLPDVYLTDLSTGAVRRVSVRSDGTSGTSGAAPLPLAMDVAVSRDGSVVAFTTTTDGLAPGDTAGKIDLFAHVVATGVTTLVNADAAGIGLPSSALNIPMVISGNGRYAAFSTTDPATGLPTALIKDLDTGAIEPADGGTSPAACSPAGMSDDGRTIAFATCYSSTGFTVMLRNLDSGASSVITSGAIAHIDGTARFAVFDSESADIVTGDENYASDTFFRIMN